LLAGENTRFGPENASLPQSDRFPASPHLRIEGISPGSGQGLAVQFVKKVVALHETFFDFQRLY
jgi:hypothetical protein